MAQIQNSEFRTYLTPRPNMPEPVVSASTRRHLAIQEALARVRSDDAPVVAALQRLDEARLPQSPVSRIEPRLEHEYIFGVDRKPAEAPKQGTRHQKPPYRFIHGRRVSTAGLKRFSAR